MQYYIESKAAFNADHDIEGTADEFMRDFKVTDYEVWSDDKRGLERTRRALIKMGFKTTPVTQDSSWGVEKNFYSSDEQVSRELLTAARLLIAPFGEGGYFPPVGAEKPTQEKGKEIFNPAVYRPMVKALAKVREKYEKKLNNEGFVSPMIVPVVNGGGSGGIATILFGLSFVSAWQTKNDLSDSEEEVYDSIMKQGRSEAKRALHSVDGAWIYEDYHRGLRGIVIGMETRGWKLNPDVHREVKRILG